MSDRLTNKWTKTAAEAFGRTGEQGDRGEAFMCKVYEAWKWDFTYYPDSYDQQVRGIDFSFKKPGWVNSYTCDVKANLNEYGTFWVETDDTGWLFNPKKESDRIWHVNPDTGWMAWYGRDDMKHYVESKGLRNTGTVKITVQDKLLFITRRRHNIIAEEQFDDVPF